MILSQEAQFGAKGLLRSLSKLLLSRVKRRKVRILNSELSIPSAKTLTLSSLFTGPGLSKPGSREMHAASPQVADGVFSPGPGPDKPQTHGWEKSGTAQNLTHTGLRWCVVGVRTS